MGDSGNNTEKKDYISVELSPDKRTYTASCGGEALIIAGVSPAGELYLALPERGPPATIALRHSCHEEERRPSLRRAYPLSPEDLVRAKLMQRRAELGTQTLTFQHPLAYVVRNEWDLGILEEIFRWRGTMYRVIWVSLPDLLGDNFPQLMEDEKIARGLDVLLVYDMRGDFISQFNGDQSKFKALY